MCTRLFNFCCSCVSKSKAINIPIQGSRRSLNKQAGAESIYNITMFTVQSDEDFENRVLKSDKQACIVDFQADWCGPCKIMGPRMEKAISLHRLCDKIAFAKVDINDLPDISDKYRIDALPTVIAFKNGKVFETLIGLKDEDEIVAYLDKLE
ncbi:hypothetical protein GJ496_010967 [Pomphorhynchus laevis]|nr:hypothetical protein GJ496_010967 [Pomphorhynchus laevis]